MRADILDAIRDATRQQILVVNITQCIRGTVRLVYETGSALFGTLNRHCYCLLPNCT